MRVLFYIYMNRLFKYFIGGNLCLNKQCSMIADLSKLTLQATMHSVVFEQQPLYMFKKINKRQKYFFINDHISDNAHLSN